ncbi:MAG: ABC transporter permease [Lachnospiraceae bacterium]|nr:ABC transporter permease [Lachnospiraceae bacterium]
MNRNKARLLSIPYIIWVIGFTVIPIIFIIARAVTDGTGSPTAANLLAIFDPIHRKALYLSLILAFLSTVICILLAFPVAVILRNSRFNKKNIIMFVLILPMWMNFILRILAIQMLISNNGIINNLLGFLSLPPLSMINTPGAIVLGMVYDYLPYMLLPVLNSVLAIPEDVIEAAKDLGAGRRAVISKIILPLSLSGIGSGITMVFVPSMTEFVIANILGGGKLQLIGNIIEQEFTTTMNWNLGSGLSVTLMVFVLITSIIFGRSSENGSKATGFTI